MSRARNLSRFKPSTTGLVANTNIASSAAIAKTKLASLDIVNADINGSAAIAKSKLASLDIVNADVNASAAIAFSKLTGVTNGITEVDEFRFCLLYTSPSPRDKRQSRMPSSA